MNWFDVSKEGLAKLFEQRGKAFVLLELLQNAWDQAVTRVDLTVTPVPGQPYARIQVEDDDPAGFADLAHAFTLFAESAKKANPVQRGRFNLGEKLVLACCERASISSTSGTVTFDAAGRHRGRIRRARGSMFDGLLRITRAELDEALAAVRTTIPPVPTYVDGARLPEREPVAVWSAALQTEVATADGYLRRAQRMTDVYAYEPRPGEVATLYELGIPVVATGDRWHVDVRQKVPLTLDRTNVPPAYLAQVRVGLLNALAGQLEAAEATQPWVREAAGHRDADPLAVARVMDLRFGARRVAYDPSDPEANKLATAQGYTVVTGGSLSSAEWANVRGAGAIRPAGQVTPSPKPFHPDGRPLRLVKDPTPAMLAFCAYARALASELLGFPDLDVELADDPGWGFGGCFGGRALTVNVAKYGGRKFYVSGPNATLLSLLLHEFGHFYAKDHLSEDYYDALTSLGARLALLALEEPALVADGLAVTRA